MSIMLVSLALSPVCGATDKVDDFIASEMSARKIPGMAVAILRHGRPVKVQVYGLADLEHGVPVKKDTLFQSASLGKQFTAAAVQLLVAEGKIGLDDPISRHLPNSPKSWNTITIRHLLTHSSGLGGYPSGFDYRRNWSEEELVAFIVDQPLAFKPGEGTLYSNFGYVLLGAIIRQKTGGFHGDFLLERLFAPAGMVMVRRMSQADLIPNRASGYELRDGILKNEYWVAPSLNQTADTGPYVNILDMVRWEQAIIENKILSKAQLDEAWTPFELPSGKRTDFGLGWAISMDGDNRTVEHGGQWQGFSSQITRYRDRGLTIILLANLARLPTWQMAYDMARIIDPGLFKADGSVEMADPE